MDIEVGEERSGEVLVLVPIGRLDSGNASSFESIVMDRVSSGELRLIVDFSRLDFISSSGLRVLLIAAKALRVADGTLVLCSMKTTSRKSPGQRLRPDHSHQGVSQSGPLRRVLTGITLSMRSSCLRSTEMLGEEKSVCIRLRSMSCLRVPGSDRVAPPVPVPAPTPRSTPRRGEDAPDSARRAGPSSSYPPGLRGIRLGATIAQWCPVAMISRYTP